MKRGERNEADATHRCTRCGVRSASARDTERLAAAGDLGHAEAGTGFFNGERRTYAAPQPGQPAAEARDAPARQDAGDGQGIVCTAHGGPGLFSVYCPQCRGSHHVHVPPAELPAHTPTLDAFWHRFLQHPTFPWFPETPKGLATAHALVEPGEVLRRERHRQGWMVRIVRCENGPAEPYRAPWWIRAFWWVTTAKES